MFDSADSYINAGGRLGAVIGFLGVVLGVAVHNAMAGAVAAALVGLAGFGVLEYHRERHFPQVPNASPLEAALMGATYRGFLIGFAVLVGSFAAQAAIHAVVH